MQVEQLAVFVYRIPTDRPEADGTIAWDSTTMVLVEITADSGDQGLGWTYGSGAAAPFIRDRLAPLVISQPVHAVGRLWERMVNAVRNVGRPGIAASAISAVDIALWDLKARAAGQPLGHLLPTHREAVPVYGSGGFTTYSERELKEQLAGWLGEGISRVKIKIGKDWGTRLDEDVDRVRWAREAIGNEAELFIDANGAYSAKVAVRQGQRFADYPVTYFEEPVSSDHLEQLAFVRQHIPIDVAAGEYGYDPWYLKNMLLAGAVDLLQADVTRCLGVTGWLMAADRPVPLSAHTAPSIHAPIACAAPNIAHVEYFYDHARIEQMLFDGAPRPVNGLLRLPEDRPGLGVEFKHQDAERWRVAV